jgi:hypothetical protein
MAQDPGEIIISTSFFGANLFCRFVTLLNSRHLPFFIESFGLTFERILAGIFLKINLIILIKFLKFGLSITQQC